MSLMMYSDMLKGTHAKLPPSQATRWATKNLTPDDIFRMICSGYAQEVGTLIHEYAENAIRYRIKILKSDKKEVRKHLLIHGIPENVVAYYVDRIFPNLMTYTNDAIGFRMDTEVPVSYSATPLAEFKSRGKLPPIFGHADALKFSKNKLMIFDLKTGLSPVHIEQLLTYASLYCLQEKLKPGCIDIELRIYQNNEVSVTIPEADDILPIMDRIVAYDKMLTNFLISEEM